jgi:cytochrome c
LRSSTLIFALAASLLTASSAFAQADPEAGKETYSGMCRACHTGAIGPVLRGVAGRKIASQPDFSGYSDGLKAKAAESWTDENLDAFIKSPSDFAAGTRMSMSVADDATRANVIAYLKTLKPTE